MKWLARVFLAAACGSGHAVSESELSTGTTETTLTETQCTETVKKVQSSGKFTEDAILPICSSEVKSSKCDFFAEALSLASTHTDFAAKVFCKDMAEAHTCSQMMDNLYESITTKDLLFGECMRSPETRSEQYCMKFKSLLGRAVHESDLDTMRACYMMQAYDEKEGPLEPKPSPTKTQVKKETKDEKAKPQATQVKKETKDEKAKPKASSKPNGKKVHVKTHATASSKPKAHPAKTTEKKPVDKAHHVKVATQNVTVATPKVPVVKVYHEVPHDTSKHSKEVQASHAKTNAGSTKPAVAKTVAKHEGKHSKPHMSATKVHVLTHKSVVGTKSEAHQALAHKDEKISKSKAHVVANTTKTSKAKTNTTDLKSKVVLAKTNASAWAKMNASAWAKMNGTANMTAAQKEAEEKKYGGFLSGFVL